MTNKLFIVCPFSHMETFIRNKFGNDIFFLTFSGAVFQHREFEYLSAVKHFIAQEKIKTIYIVNDTSCRFINGIIHEDPLFGLRSEKVIVDLYIEHYFSEFKDQSIANQQKRLAELNVLKQANEIKTSDILGAHISEFDLEIKCLVTSRDENKFTVLQMESSETRIYEL